MVAAGELILRFAKGGRPRFLANVMVRSAIERQFELFGEAARRLSPAFREAHPEVPWRTIIAFRNNLIHGYGGIMPEKVWDGIGKGLKPAMEALRPLLR